MTSKEMHEADRRFAEHCILIMGMAKAYTSLAFSMTAEQREKSILIMRTAIVELDIMGKDLPQTQEMIQYFQDLRDLKLLWL